jgi:hypothetical protein
MAVQQNQPIPIWEIISTVAGLTVGALLAPMVILPHLGNLLGSVVLGETLCGGAGYGVPALVRTARGR